MGTRGDKWHLQSTFLKPKTNPQEKHGKDYAEGEGKRAPRHHCSLRLAFQGTGLILLLYDLSSVAFCTSPLPPGRCGSVAAGCV